MDAVDNDGAPPAPLRLAWLCGDHHLPDAGGALDQDFQTMAQMAAASNVYQTLSRYRGLRGEQIHSLSHSERRLLGYLQRQGLL